jgi:biopolymer transport protein ExbD
MNVRGSLACFITASLALLLVACEKPANEESRNPDGPEAKENTQSFATLPLLWQEKGAIEEATEDLMALHVAMQRYLEANGDIWPRAPQLVMDEVVKEHPDHDAHLVEPNADSLAAYRKFWEDTLKPFGATAQHWQNSHPDLFNPPFYKANRFAREKGAAYGKNNGNKALRWRFSEVVWFTIEYGVGPEKIFITASGRVKNTDTSADHLIKLPTDSRPQSLTQTAGNLIKVNIRHNGAMVVMGQQVTEEGLTKWINERFEKNPDLKVLIRCDKESKHLYLANVMSICRYVGVPKANIAIRTEK